MGREQDSRRSLETLYSGSDDPWNYRSLWYEARKRALTLACLPARRFARAYEPGCSNGELSALLAERCDKLLISDGVARAVGAARRRVKDLQNVEAIQAWVPDDWPHQSFDLIVISEVAYFLEPSAMALLARKAAASLQPGGTVLACHWRRPMEGHALDGDTVHRQMHEQMALPHISELVEDDFRIDVWCRDARSIAQRDGLA